MKTMFSEIKELCDKAIKSDASQEQMVDGFAMGTFLAFLPILGFHTLLALVVSLLFKKNKWTTILGTWVNNPFTMIPIYVASYWVGTWFYPNSIALSRFHYVLINLRVEHLSDLSARFLIPLWIGCCLVGVVSAFFVRWLGHNHGLTIYRVFSDRSQKKAKQNLV